MAKARGDVTKAEIRRALEVALESNFEIYGFATYSRRGKVEIILDKSPKADSGFYDPDELLQSNVLQFVKEGKK